jgi:hypothetical protein
MKDELLKVIEDQQKEIEKLDREVIKLYIWLSIVGLTASLSTLILIYK